MGKELQRKPKDSKHLKMFLSTSRSFGDQALKNPDAIVTAAPDVKVVDLVPEDWAVVLCSDGVVDRLTDQQVANVVWKAMVVDGKDAVGAAKALVQVSLKAGARDNLTAVVMRLGWASPPSSDKVGDADTVAAAAGGSDMNIFG